jgi:hypothetical protein
MNFIKNKNLLKIKNLGHSGIFEDILVFRGHSGILEDILVFFLTLKKKNFL